MYTSRGYGKLIIYVDSDVICANWERESLAPGSHSRWEPTQRHNCKIWNCKTGTFYEDELRELAGKCSDDVETMIHWIKEEVVKFASAVIPLPEEETI
jgi:hypothetical protein